jgi:hypothetical protein
MPSIRRASPGRAVTPRALSRRPAQVARPRAGRSPAIVRRGEGRRAGIASQVRRGSAIERRDIVRQRGPDRPDRPSLARRTPGDRDLRRGSAPALAGDRTTAIQRSVLRNRALANVSGRDRSARALSRATFRGKFAERGKRFANPPWAKRFHHVKFDRHRFHRKIFVIGWIGPLFWPFAYDDFIDYTFWPYAYDTFWPYAYDDVYVSIYGPYAYAGGGAYANLPVYRDGGRTRVRVPPSGVADVCSVEAAGLTDWPIERIAEVVEPDDAQRAVLAELRDATARAIELMKSACPSDLPGTPTGRLAAMRTRIETMLQALAVVKPALERFYNGLSDEQKARFNALSDEPPTARGPRTASRQAPDLARACPAEMTARLPVDRVRQAVQPTAEQAGALDALNEASRRAGELLRANCEGDDSLTPTGRVAAMERRLNAMLEALNIVQQALEQFYGSLSDEQKARFNRLGTRQARR